VLDQSLTHPLSCLDFVLKQQSIKHNYVKVGCNGLSSCFFCCYSYL